MIQNSLTVNGSRFHRKVMNSHCIIYSATPDELIPINSLEEARHPNYWRDSFHPFAEVIVNPDKHEYLLVRDHLGIRPLYYAYQAGKLVFGDTIPDVLQHLPKTPELLDTAVVCFLSNAPSYTDETLYQGVYRVEPGTMVYIQSNGTIEKKAFWQLEPTGEVLYYSDEREYLDHFCHLMQEAVQVAVKGQPSIAAEFSAGMDSSAVYCAAVQCGLNPTLFMHDAIADSEDARRYNKKYESLFLDHFPQAVVQRLQAEGFDPLSVFEQYADWFSGPSPYIFEPFAYTLHQAVGAQGYSILLSGFGGDQGVSHPIPVHFTLPELLHQNKLRQAWLNTQRQNPSLGLTFRRFLMLLRYVHPLTHHWLQQIEDLTHQLTNVFRKTSKKRYPSPYPYHRSYFKTLREAEWSFLQGPDSHEVRMRIEYSSVVAKKRGFSYRYPLLYPKLLAFFLSLPMSQKRHNGQGRYLMRRYLARCVPGIFDGYQKKEGLSILAATMNVFETQYKAGDFQKVFQTLPYANCLNDTLPYRVMLKKIRAFMLKTQLD